MRILVVGATGGTGREIVRQALERGHEVTAFVRRSGRLGVEHERLREATGDVRDAVAVRAAVAGQQAVLSALGHKRWFYPNDILSGGTRAIVEAMREEGVRRFICETSLGVGDSIGRLGLYYTLFTIPVILPFYYWDKGRQERVIRASDLDWTIVRPAVLTNGPARGRYRHGPKVGSYILTRRISRADVAAFMLDQLKDTTYLRAAPGLAG